MKKTVIVVSLCLSGIFVLAWPLVAYMSIFAFDAPIAGPMDGALRTAFVLLAVSYPLTFVGVLLWVIRKWKRKTLRLAHALWALLPIAQLFGPPLFGSALSDHLKHRKKEVANGVYIGIEGNARRLFLKEGSRLEEVIGPEVIYYLASPDSSALLVKQAKHRDLGKGLTSVSFKELQYFAVILAKHEIEGPFTEEELISRWGIDSSSAIFHETRIP